MLCIRYTLCPAHLRKQKLTQDIKICLSSLVAQANLLTVDVAKLRLSMPQVPRTLPSRTVQLQARLKLSGFLLPHPMCPTAGCTECRHAMRTICRRPAKPADAGHNTLRRRKSGAASPRAAWPTVLFELPRWRQASPCSQQPRLLYTLAGSHPFLQPSAGRATQTFWLAGDLAD